MKPWSPSAAREAARAAHYRLTAEHRADAAAMVRGLLADDAAFHSAEALIAAFPHACPVEILAVLAEQAGGLR